MGYNENGGFCAHWRNYMKWNKFTIKTITEAEDIISATLGDLGVEGVQIEDKIPLSKEDKEKMFIDILPVLPPDDGIAYVSFFLENGQDHTEMLTQIKQELESLKDFMDIGECTIEETLTDDIDWINNWKEFFKPFSVDDIYIKPTWEDVTEDAAGRKIIEIDPGTAFGTGKHETTQLCIRAMRKYISPEKKVLDVGCGSGILSIVALKEGAFSVDGIDVDENAIKASFENSRINHLDCDKYTYVTGNIIDDATLLEKYGKEQYDIVVANILADIIIPLTPIARLCLKKGGIFISSGIIDIKEEAVVEAVKQSGFEVIEVARQGDWRAVIARK